MNKQAHEPRKKFELSAKARFRFVVGVAFFCIAWMQYLAPSASSGRWDWLDSFVIQYLGRSGFLAVLVLLGIILVSSALIEMIRNSRSN